MERHFEMSLLQSLSSRGLAAPNSGISDVIDYANGRDNLIKLWVGEGDLPSPSFINAAAIDSLNKGETFYTYQRGIPELRQALSRSAISLLLFSSALQAMRRLLTFRPATSPQRLRRLISQAYP